MILMLKSNENCSITLNGVISVTQNQLCNNNHVAVVIQYILNKERIYYAVDNLIEISCMMHSYVGNGEREE